MLNSIRPLPLLLACAASSCFTAVGLADELAARVTTRIRESVDLRAAPIEIRALGPTVWLTGTVADETQKRSAMSLAEATPGVERVIDQIVVSRPAAPAIDAAFAPAAAPKPIQKPVGARHAFKEPAAAASAVHAPKDIAAEVAAALRDSGKLSGYRVSVKAKDGTVWLSGTLASREQLQAAVTVAETSPGVERVVNRLVVSDAAKAGSANDEPGVLSLSGSLRALLGESKTDAAVQQAAATGGEGRVVRATGGSDPAESTGVIQLVEAQYPIARANYPSQQPNVAGGFHPNGPRPLGASGARPMPSRGSYAGRPPRSAVRAAGYGEAMALPGPDGHDFGAAGGLVDGQMVPGSMRISEGGLAVPNGGMPMGPMAGGAGMGRPMPMGGAGVGMPAVPVRGGGPNMPNYAWPSYAANPNYAAIQYPTQYSPTAWPYIGPFYPYPQVPLGWRRVSLEWDDGWWFLDFDDRHHHSHHR